VQSNSIVEQEDWAAPRKSGALTAEVVCNTNRALQSLHTRIQNQKSAQQFAQSYFDSLESRPSWHSRVEFLLKTESGYLRDAGVT